MLAVIIITKEKFSYPDVTTTYMSRLITVTLIQGALMFSCNYPGIFFPPAGDDQNNFMQPYFSLHTDM